MKYRPIAADPGTYRSIRFSLKVDFPLVFWSYLVILDNPGKRGPDGCESEGRRFESRRAHSFNLSDPVHRGRVNLGQILGFWELILYAGSLFQNASLVDPLTGDM